MTRDEEIENLAMQLYISAPEDSMCADPRECFRASEDFFVDRDRWRATRAASAPEKTTPEPEPRIEVLKRWLECCVELGFEARLTVGQISYLLIVGNDEIKGTSDELEALRAHAAKLREQREGDRG